jgi:hypothetical protein
MRRISWYCYDDPKVQTRFEWVEETRVGTLSIYWQKGLMLEVPEVSCAEEEIIRSEPERLKVWTKKS